MVGPNEEPTDAVAESASSVLASALETERDDDWNAAKTIATGITTITSTMATRHHSVENRQLARRTCAFGVKHPPRRRTFSLDL